MDATLFNGRANLEATLYQKSIGDLLLTRTLPGTAGFSQLVFNGGDIRNRGVELGLTVLPVQSASFHWTAHGTFFLNRCIVTSLPVPTFQPTSFFNFSIIGTTQIEVNKSCTQVIANDTLGRLPGDAALGTIGDIVVRQIGDNSPTFRSGLSNELAYKRVKLYFLWDWQRGGMITNWSRYTYDVVGNSADQTTAKNPGDLTGSQRKAIGFTEPLNSVTWDASYLKLREATLTVDLPASFVKRLWSGARFVRLSVSGRNLLTFSPYTKVGYDPEVQQVHRSLAVEMSWELWAYPASRSAFFSIDVGF